MLFAKCLTFVVNTVHEITSGAMVLPLRAIRTKRHLGLNCTLWIYALVPMLWPNVVLTDQLKLEMKTFVCKMVVTLN